MTSTQSVKVMCPKCDNAWSAVVYTSICTWLDPEVVEELYNGGFQIECPACGLKMRVGGTVLISGPQGMFWLDAGQDIESIRQALRSSGVVDHSGKTILSRPAGPD